MKLHWGRIGAFIILPVMAFALGYILADRPDPAAATINGQPILLSDLDQELRHRFGGEVLRDMVHRELIRQEMDKHGIVIEPGQVDRRLTELKQDPQVAALLRSGRLAEDDLRRNLTTLIPLDELILNGVGPDQQRQFFEEHLLDLQRVRARHILVATEEEALRLKADLDSGEDFAALAQEHSLDQNTRDRGGDLGFLSRNQMEPELATAAFSPEAPGGVVATTRFGSHLLQVAEQRLEFEELTREIREAMAEPDRGTFVQTLRKGAQIDIHLDRVDLDAPGEGSLQ